MKDVRAEAPARGTPLVRCPNRRPLGSLAAEALEGHYVLMSWRTLLVAFGLVGCAHSTAVGSAHGRARHLADLEQKVLAVGPAIVTHVSAAGDGTLFLYSAPVKTGTDDDCEVSDGEMQPYFPIEAGADRDVNVSVPPGEVECAAVAMGMGMDVTWRVAPGTASASR